jgi:hypothetical protein
MCTVVCVVGVESNIGECECVSGESSNHLCMRAPVSVTSVCVAMFVIYYYDAECKSVRDFQSVSASASSISRSSVSSSRASSSRSSPCISFD